jgi:hypothetical protein
VSWNSSVIERNESRFGVFSDTSVLSRVFPRMPLTNQAIGYFWEFIGKGLMHRAYPSWSDKAVPSDARGGFGGKWLCER